MTVSTTNNRTAYTGNGTTTVFAFPYKFLEKTDLVVYVDGVIKTLNVDYTVGTPSDFGANVTFSSAPASSASVVIFADPNLLQSSDLPSTGPFPSSTVEQMVDKVTLQVQRLRDLANRAFRLSDADISGASSVLPTPSPRKALIWALDGLSLINSTYDPDAASVAADTAVAAATQATVAYQQFHGQYYGPLAADPSADPYGNPLAAGDLYQNTGTGSLRIYTGSAWTDTAQATPVSYNSQLFNGTGAQTAFTLSSAPASLLATEVFISGVRQRSTTDYTVSGTTLTFTAAPASGTNNIFIRWTNSIAVGVPNNKSVTYPKIQDVPNKRLLGRNSAAAGDVEEVTLTQLLDWIGTAAQGDILFRSASSWQRLAAGLSGQVLKTLGTGADPAWGGGLVSGTAVNTTSGTAIDFTGIPSWAKRITVMLNGVSTNGASIPQLQIGAGSIDTTGYNGNIQMGSGAGYYITGQSTGFPLTAATPATSTNQINGFIQLCYMGASLNTWVVSGNLISSTYIVGACSGHKALSGILDRIRLTTVNGTDTFDLGSINILWE